MLVTLYFHQPGPDQGRLAEVERCQRIRFDEPLQCMRALRGGHGGQVVAGHFEACVGFDELLRYALDLGEPAAQDVMAVDHRLQGHGQLLAMQFTLQ
ncbi:hypothetical protein D3C76_346220 [compost metagenome]